MIKAKITSERKLRVLAICRNNIGNVVDLDDDIANPLSLAHDVVSETLGKLRRGGFLSYHCFRGLDGSMMYRMDSASTIIMDEQPTLFGGF